MRDKAHLLYMTGLSIDKNRMNNITENINFIIPQQKQTTFSKV